MRAHLVHPLFYHPHRHLPLLSFQIDISCATITTIIIVIATIIIISIIIVITTIILGILYYFDIRFCIAAVRLGHFK